MTEEKHPSLLFQQKGIQNFRDALRVYLQQYQFELRKGYSLHLELHDQSPPGFDAAKDRALLEEQAREVAHIKKMVEIAEDIYQECVHEAIGRCADRLQGEGDTHMKKLAQALLTGNYEDLAI